MKRLTLHRLNFVAITSEINFKPALNISTLPEYAFIA
jgi:hypothetical protein